MKKKSLPKLTLNRDTVAQLDAPKLEWAGGVVPPSAQNSLCDMISCLSNCRICVS
ncbi:MAG TPA: class I lanthipeptide [Thermoanaerobaculia bacterium]|nr:class I lanthipeptide [Thermoanaerobaculia bacterium]